MSHRIKVFPNIKKQTGNLYIVAIFVIVVMGFLANALARMEWSNQDALSKDLLGTRAWFAAHSANELALTYLYPIREDLDEASVVKTTCEDNWSDVGSVAADLVKDNFAGCSIRSMSCNEMDQLDSQHVYKVETAVQCGSGQFQVERQQEVWVKE
ncbi:MSHA biogenesis protein MshP [Vibrio ziniensis]|uniref:MSHA biogenesis protein MshP n=1 Tax=Vibrio ziniensis TaxID=2711221 RepID=A0A6G7CL24_9VIBR|nr:MSHA biogenesis protein MshP [Vibrio ziniensis]QIH42827.1 MSHA biogenesis protein MshP [Vibrio ziniensis]